MGTWSLVQAQALLELGMDVEVVSCTSWVPRFLGSLVLRQALPYVLVHTNGYIAMKIKDL